MFDKLTFKQKEIIKYMTMMIFLGAVVFICNYQNVVRSYNSTLLALSYKYGFTSRSLLGTIYHIIDSILPQNMMDYSMTLLFAQITTGMFFLFIYFFMYLCLRRCDLEYLKVIEYIFLFFIVFIVSTFSGGYNFFRVDFCMVLCSLFCVLLLIHNKMEWLIIPISAIGVMFHQGYVFMFFNVTLILLICKFLSTNKVCRIKYGCLFIITFLVGSGLFLWFEFFSRSNGELFLDQIVSEARALSLNGEYHTTLLQHEVLGIDLSEAEKEFRMLNFVQLSVLIILCLPYISLMIYFFRNLIKNAQTKVDKIKYIFVFIGAGTLIPNFILKIDYGRWILALIVYYLVVLAALVAMGDRNIGLELNNVFKYISNKSWSFLLIIYPILFIPLYDVEINELVQVLWDQINTKFLN